jgi:hypothetical protein
MIENFKTKKANDGVNMLKEMISCIFHTTEVRGDVTFADFKINFAFNRFFTLMISSENLFHMSYKLLYPVGVVLALFCCYLQSS